MNRCLIHEQQNRARRLKLEASIRGALVGLALYMRSRWWLLRLIVAWRKAHPVVAAVAVPAKRYSPGYQRRLEKRRLMREAA